MSLLKIPLILAAAGGLQLTLTPPVKAERSEVAHDVPIGERVFSIIMGSIQVFNKVTVWTIGVCESAVILAHSYPDHPLSQVVTEHLVWGNGYFVANVGISRTFMIGWSLAMAGSLTRLACYRELGRHFTFEVSLRKNHQLVTTGPYSIVRHPSYSAIVLVFAGISLCVAGAGSWLVECGWLETIWGKALVATLVGSRLYSTVQLLARPRVEDKLLEKEFGEQWRAWARRVPSRLIPGIY